MFVASPFGFDSWTKSACPPLLILYSWTNRIQKHGLLFKWSFPLTSPSCLWPVLLSTAWRLNLLPNTGRTLWASASTYAPNFWHLCMPRAMYISWLVLGHGYLLLTSTECTRSAAAEVLGNVLLLNDTHILTTVKGAWGGRAVEQGTECHSFGFELQLALWPPPPWLRYQNTEPSASYFGAIAGSVGLISYT